ncbi:UvrD-helicase domain-containing protein [Sphingobacterium sp. HJSM2_6]|uniref:UvrD-helicase domain-containing protein n=1 Tax=Sphingobacterium sp. HJSM2_6 TaxID=3366264 RepID=UPI003BE6645B
MKNVAPLSILKASAGSGKTFSLTIHYIALLLEKETNYREILAVTFTNKATAEMKERILSVLKGLALGHESNFINQYRFQILDQYPQWTKIDLREKSYRIYQRILHDYSHFSVSTIDGFSQKVIRSFTYELNLDAGYRIEMNTSKVKQDLTIMLNHLLDEKPELLDWIIRFAEQKINNNENWNYRQQLTSLASLIFSENFQEFDSYIQGADSHQIFNLLHTEISKKSEEFRTALASAITAFHEEFQKLGIDESEMKGKSRNKVVSASKISPHIHKLSNQELQEKIFDKFIALNDNEAEFTDQTKEIRYDLIFALQPYIDSIVALQRHFARYIAFQAVDSNLYYLRLLKEMSELLSVWRKENSAQLISDAQILLNKLGLDEHNDPTFIWEKIGNRYNYFLFDEFQDTSRIQWKNYSPLLLNALSTSAGKWNEHLIVGDVKQSIYRWRNGDWRILLSQVEQQVMDNFHLSQTDKDRFLKISSLDNNHRSLANIIKLNNYLFSSIPNLLQNVLNEKVNEVLNEEGKNWWNTSGNAELLIKAYAGSEQQIPVKKLDSSHPQGSIEINFFPVSDNRYRNNQVMELATAAVCQKIGEWIQSGRYEPAQIGILVRSNKQAQTIIHALMRYKYEQNLNFDVVSGDALTLSSNHAIALLLETLKAFVFQSDQHVIIHANMCYYYQLINGQSSFEPSTWLTFKHNSLVDLAGILPHQLIEQWAMLQKMPMVHLIEKLIEIYELGSTGSIHLPYLLAFKDIITQFSSRGDRGIIQFLEYWEEDGQRAVLPTNGEINAIEVTTIHKSKGLAYDVVMIPYSSWAIDGMINSDFWISVADTEFETLGKIPVKYTQILGRSIFYKQYYEEMLFNYMDALNTFYVANTRAKQHLYISAPAFKEIRDKKKEDEIIGFDVKSEYISDILYQALSAAQSPFKLQDLQLNIQEIILPKPAEKESLLHIPTAINHYPVSTELDKVFNRTVKENVNQILLLEKAAQYGELAHEIIALVYEEKDILRLVDQYIQEGIIASAEREILLDEINQIWKHPLIKQWLSGDYKIWNEASILIAGGETKRPDKVFTSPNETIVLDFKFTQGNYSKHKEQVDLYMEALRSIGYQNVKGYLYYAKTRELVQVI